MGVQAADISGAAAAIDAESTDAVLTEFTFVGASALALSRERRPPLVACDILPLGSPVSGAPLLLALRG